MNILVYRSSLRDCDTVGPIGGEKFAILLPETASQQAFEIAERVRRAMTFAELSVDGRPPPKILITIDIVVDTDMDAHIDALLNRADKALYTAKITGRNRVVLAES